MFAHVVFVRVFTLACRVYACVNMAIGLMVSMCERTNPVAYDLLNARTDETPLDSKTPDAFTWNLNCMAFTYRAEHFIINLLFLQP